MKMRVLFSTVILLALTGVLFAQSGRKSTSSSSPTTTTTTTTTETTSGPKITEKKTTATPKVQLRVGIDRRTSFTTVPLYVFDTVLDNVIRRLGEAEIVFATSGGDMNRSDAVKAAKQEKDRWLIVLEVKSIYADTGNQVKNNQDELVVSFVAIEPETGKIKRSGQSHQTIYQNGRGGISLPTKNGAVYSEYSIKQAADDAADRILAGFDISVGSSVPR